MTKISDYKPFNKFVFRSPTLPFSSKDYNLVNTPLFLEAIYLASPDLFEAISKVKELNFDQLENKVRLSVLKYLLRMKYRSTPFGLFAGCGIGSIGKVSMIDLDELHKAKSFTRLDMEYLCALTDCLNNDLVLKELLLYYPNNSIYKISDGARYVEYKYFNGKRKHFISEYEVNEYIELIIQKTTNGLSFQNMTNIVFDDLDDFSRQEKQNFIMSLIDNQVLVSELQPTLTGGELIGKVIGTVERHLFGHQSIKMIKQIESNLKKIDSLAIGRPIELYRDTNLIIDKLEVKYNPKFLFQSDLLLKTTKSTISHELVDSVSEGLYALSRLTTNNTPPALANFIEKFSSRYESREVSLVEALDPEMGIGFSNSNAITTDVNELIDDIPIRRRLVSSNDDFDIRPIDKLLIEKYYKCISENASEVLIEEKDLNYFPEKNYQLPLTIAVMIEVLDVEKKLVHIKSAGGPSATCLIGRFGHISEDIKELLEEITNFEQGKVGENAILAEIVHLPDSRIGNILFRPVLRGYEIPYLSESSLGDDNTVRLDDLMVSVINGNYIKLRSKRLDKEIIPRLASAHNYTYNSLPIYSFLCMLQSQQTMNHLSFSWGTYLSSKEFLPRVMYRKAILSPAKWNIGGARLKSLPTVRDIDFYQKVLDFRKELSLPQLVYLVRADNKLLIDFSDESSTKLLLSEIRERQFTLEEFLFDLENNLVTRSSEQFTNEVILCFHN